ncbi:MAG: hypothetical protein ACE5JN_09260 [Candidatus Methylomirabilia bacterium]
MRRVRMSLNVFYADMGRHVVTRLDKLLSKKGQLYLAGLADAATGKPDKRKAFERGFLGLLSRECPDVMKLIPANYRAPFMTGIWEAVRDGRLPHAVRRWRRVRGIPGGLRQAVRPRRQLDVGYSRDRRLLLARQRARIQARRSR